MSTIISNAEILILFVLMLGVLVFVHELGHFAVAKRLKIPVPEFGFGFPPRVLKFWQGAGWMEIQSKHIIIPPKFKLPQNLNVGSLVRYKSEIQSRRETLTELLVVDPESQGATLASPVQGLDRGTEYTLNAIPLGGFVRLMGEEDPNVPGGFASAKPSVRAPILLAGVTMNLILAFLVFAFIAFVMPPYVSVATTRISQVEADTPAAEVGLRPGDVVTAVNGQDVTNRLEMLQQLIGQNAGRAVTLTIARNGKTLAPIAVAPRVLAPNTSARLGIALDAPRGLEVMAVEPDSVAARAGVRPGDVLIFVSDPRGQTLIDQNDLVKFTTTHAGFKIEWRIERDGKLLDPITVQIPAEATAPNAALGLRLYNTPLDASARSIEEMWTMVASLPRVFSQLLSGSVPPNSFVGPIGIAQVTGEVAQRAGFIGLLNLLGLLSVNLAVVNLLPFPALDGGRLIFVLLEWLRGGKKIDPQKEGVVHLVGIVVLLGLMLIISFFDVQRLISGQSIFP